MLTPFELYPSALALTTELYCSGLSDPRWPLPSTYCSAWWFARHFMFTIHLRPGDDLSGDLHPLNNTSHWKPPGSIRPPYLYKTIHTSSTMSSQSDEFPPTLKMQQQLDQGEGNWINCHLRWDQKVGALIRGWVFATKTRWCISWSPKKRQPRVMIIIWPSAAQCARYWDSSSQRHKTTTSCQGPQVHNVSTMRQTCISLWSTIHLQKHVWHGSQHHYPTQECGEDFCEIVVEKRQPSQDNTAT